MSVVHFQCPSCQAPLRLQNRALFVGRTFDCPDCHESLLIEADGSAGVKAKPLPRFGKRARRASEGSSVPTVGDPLLARRAGLKSASSVSDLGVSLQSPPTVWDRLSRRPGALGWTVAALFAMTLLVVVNSGRDQGRSKVVPPVVDKSPVASSVSNDNSAPADPVGQNSNAVTELDPTLSETDAKQVVATLEIPPLPEPATVAERPGDANQNANAALAPENPVAGEPKPADPPARVVLSPEAVAAKLGQKIARFDQPKPVPFVKVLDTVEELAGVSIVWDLDRVDDEQLQKPVTLQLKQTTVGEILDSLLKQVGLERRTVEGKIELHPPAQED